MSNKPNEIHIEGATIIDHNNNCSSTNIEESQKKMQQELIDLQQRFDKISEQIQDLQNDKLAFKSSIKTMNDSFQQVSKNVEDILSKLDNFSNPNKGLNADDLIARKMKFSMKKIIFNPLRKLAVGTISSILSVTDRAIESTCVIKEGFEDIVADAQYQRKKKYMASMTES